MSQWIDGAHRRDLSGRRGNGPFQQFLGVVLHVNVSGRHSQGTSPDWYAEGGGGDQVCPNFQVMRDGTIWQMLPLDWQPWTQAAGNYNYASIETGGNPDMPLTDAQIKSCARIVQAYHDHMGMPLRLANKPGDRGFGTHAMGGQAWGGHPCPGAIRTRQRADILAYLNRPKPSDPFEEFADMTPAQRNDLIQDIADAVWAKKLTKKRTAAQMVRYTYDRLIRVEKKVR